MLLQRLDRRFGAAVPNPHRSSGRGYRKGLLACCVSPLVIARLIFDHHRDVGLYLYLGSSSVGSNALEILPGGCLSECGIHIPSHRPDQRL